MAKSPLFTDDPATDMSYINIRDAADDRMLAVRRNCEELWNDFEPFADDEFRIEIRKNFDARYWEMYLSVFLLREGYEISCPKPGPDVGIIFNGCRIWFEATCPERGSDQNPDQVPDVKVARVGEDLVFRETPNEKMVLRYLNSISEKRRQYMAWLANKTVAVEDAFVVSINPRRLRHDFADTRPPRILQAAFPLGSPYASIDPETSQVVDVGYQFRSKVSRQSGAEVPTGIFLLKDYSCLSALLCSRVDAANQPLTMGADFQFVENPLTSASLPDWFRLKGTFFQIEYRDGNYRAIPQQDFRFSLR